MLEINTGGGGPPLIELRFTEVAHPAISTNTIDGGRHAPASVLVRWLREDGRFEELPADPSPDPLPSLLEGDLPCFRIGQGVAHHLGLVTSPDGEFVHCLRGHGAIASSLQDPTYRRVLTNLFRPKWVWIHHEGTKGTKGSENHSFDARFSDGPTFGTFVPSW